MKRKQAQIMKTRMILLTGGYVIFFQMLRCGDMDRMLQENKELRKLIRSLRLREVAPEDFQQEEEEA